MPPVYSLAEREQARRACRQLQTYAQEAQISAQTGQPLLPAVAEAIQNITHNGDVSKQIDVLNMLSEDVRRRHVAKLLPLAKDDFTAFCEYINPEEPPESKWHIWLTSKLQEIEVNPALSRFILNCPPGHAKPLHVDTPVLMGDGSWARLGDIKVGDMVLTEKGRSRKVTAVHEQGVLPLLKITTKRGRVLHSAFDHSFRTFDPEGNPIWKEAQALRPGSALHLVHGHAHPHTVGNPSKRSKRDAVVAGLFAAVGSAIISEAASHYRLWIRDPDRLEVAERLLKEHSFKFATYPPGKHSRYMVRLGGSTMARVLPYLYRGRLREERRIPSWVFNSSDEVAMLFLTTFYSQLGKLSIRRAVPHYEVMVYNYLFAQDLNRLLARFGIDSTFKQTKSKRERWMININGVGLQRFLEQGFQHPRLHLADIDTTSLKPMPLDRDYVEAIEFAQDGECRCLTVEEDHTFLADGIVVHNSTYASRLFVAWRMGRNPTHKVIGGGHSQTFVENEFSKKIRDIVTSPEFNTLFPEVVVDKDTRSKSQWVLAGKGGQYAARGVGQGVHGFRAHFVCVDDPYSKIEAAESPVEREKVETWFTGDLGSRMLPTGKMFLIMTRFHENDLTGYLMEMNKTLPSYAKWYQVEAPALCYDPETDVLGRQMGEVLWDYYDLQYFLTKRTEWSFQRFSLVYQQRTDASSADKITGGFQYYEVLPHQTEEALTKARMEGRVDEYGKPLTNRREYFRKIIVSVDTASKPGERNDYTVVQTWGQTTNNKHYLLRQNRFKKTFPEMCMEIERQAKLDDADVILVEDKGQGTAYIQARGSTETQKRLAPCPIIGIDPQGQSKEFRYDEISPMIAAGDVFLPKRAPWLDIYLKEFGQFPDGAHDDQVDTTTQYLKYVKNTRRRYGSRTFGSVG